MQRPAARVAEDAAEGLISRKAARDFYGVVLRGNLSLDETATKRLRDRLGSTRKAKLRAKKVAKRRKRR